MRIQHAVLFRFFAALPAIILSGTIAGAAPATETSEDFPQSVRFKLGRAKFAPGDGITIRQMHGTSELITTGETYCVEGTYTLDSRDEAELAFYSTSISASGPSQVDARQIVRIKKGSGSFRLIKTMKEDGYLHLSFYPVPSGSDFGGVYFGQGDRVLKEGFDHTRHHSSISNMSAPTTLSGPNQVLLEYLGNPVEPPANLDARYTKGGLTQAIQLAARQAGITLQEITIDDSEYPFLVGAIFEEADFAGLKDRINRMEGYKYGGGVNGHRRFAFNIIPHSIWPLDPDQRIDHRLMLRLQVLNDRLKTPDNPTR